MEVEIWQICAELRLLVLRNKEEEDFVGVKLEGRDGAWSVVERLLIRG